MNRRLTMIIVLLALLLLVTPLAAKEAPIKITVEGPGLGSPVTVREGALMDAVTQYAFHDYQIAAPDEPPTDGYTITRYMDEAQGFDRVTYYPDPADGRAIAFYDGPVDPAARIDGQGEWYAVRMEGDAAMRAFLVAQGIRLDSHPATSAPTPMPGLWLIGVIAGLVALSIRLRRRTQPAAPVGG